ncbi:MAG: transposase [Verrucomicrobiaceae bacterium]|nr:transposase [Verrucomicrobiaceae bacterium]
MPRQLRIQYAGAVYHVLARGDRREDIVQDDEDRELFVATLAEACKKTGWEVLAWVLMDNHYHCWLIRTPEPNLVEGMKWFQNAYTRRFNARHKLWGGSCLAAGARRFRCRRTARARVIAARC